MQKLASELLADIDKETIDWVLNYDDMSPELQSVLPTRVPNLLLNGAVGIAVGMATNIPPHNLTELVDATVALIDRLSPTCARCFRHRARPRLQLRPHHRSLRHRAGLCQRPRQHQKRARCEIEEDGKGREAIIVTEIPVPGEQGPFVDRAHRRARAREEDRGIRTCRTTRIALACGSGSSVMPPARSYSTTCTS
ncbi:MAG: DNA gyrase subunit A [Nannocystaceae bacterium]